MRIELARPYEQLVANELRRSSVHRSLKVRTWLIVRVRYKERGPQSRRMKDISFKQIVVAASGWSAANGSQANDGYE